MQEVDLAAGMTLLGRSPDCAVTIEDPLVSREHARITIRGDAATFEDLGSRNGSRINGVPVRQATPLKDGDRLRIGTQELVFCKFASDRSGPSNRRTGFMTYCARCKLPYPEEMGACPHCGSLERLEEEATLTGAKAADDSTWALLLATDVLERAVANGRHADAERILRRSANALGETIAAKAAVDEEQLRKLAVVAAKYARVQSSSQWACWLLGVFDSLERVPPVEAVSELQGIRLEDAAGPRAIDSIIRSSKARRSTLRQSDLEALSILELWGISIQKNTGP